MSLLNQIYQLKTQLKQEFNPIELIEEISEPLNCEVYLVNSLGDILVSSATQNPNATGAQTLKQDFKQRLFSIHESITNVPIEFSFINEEGAISKKQFVIILPLKTIGFLIFAKSNELFNNQEQIFAEISALLLETAIRENNYKGELPKKPSFQRILGSLTHSELTILKSVFRELKNKEGILVASKIADANGASRSTIVNGLRKLEIPGIITARSLGMRGTYVKLEVPEFIEFLQNEGQDEVG